MRPWVQSSVLKTHFSRAPLVEKYCGLLGAHCKSLIKLSLFQERFATYRAVLCDRLNNETALFSSWFDLSMPIVLNGIHSEFTDGLAVETGFSFGP